MTWSKDLLLKLIRLKLVPVLAALEERWSVTRVIAARKEVCDLKCSASVVYCANAPATLSSTYNQVLMPLAGAGVRTLAAVAEAVRERGAAACH